MLDQPDGTDYVGTLRWHPSTTFPDLPQSDRLAPLTGWEQYFHIRLSCPDEDDDTVSQSPAQEPYVLQPQQLDGLSFPLTCARMMRVAMQAKVICPQACAHLMVVNVGAAAKAEERLLRQSSYWSELRNYVWPGCSKVTLWLVGPEVSASELNVSTRCSSSSRVEFAAHTHRGGIGEWIKLHAAEMSDSSTQPMMYATNTGMGAGNMKLTLAWLPDIIELIRLNIPIIFTCANDYADVKGETIIMHSVLRAKVVREPEKNLFSAVTTVHAPDARETTWSCPNSFVYMIKGFLDGEQQPPSWEEGGKVIMLKRLQSIKSQMPVSLPR